MAGLALALKNTGWEVSGSDQKDVYPPVTTFLEKNEIKYFKGYSEDNLSFVPDLVVVGRSSLMIDPNNPEYFKAKKLGFKIFSYPEVVRDFLIKKNSIVVAGTYGKTTTTTLISLILENWGVNPSFMIGGLPLNFSEGTRITDSKYSVVEGDETPALLQTDLPKFMFYKPKYLLLTATEFDHPEVYKTKAAYIKAFIDLVKLLPLDGILFYDQATVDEKVIAACNVKKIAFLPSVDFSLAENYKQSALRAITVCREIGVPEQVIRDAVFSFKGLQTKQEFLGVFAGRFLYQDSAQQSAKVKAAISALKSQRPENKIVVIFNPSATSLKYKNGLIGYNEAFADTDQVIIAKVDFLTKVFKEQRVTGPDLVEAFGGSPKAVYEPISENILSRLVETTSKGDVVLFLSSGGLNFYNFVEEVKKKLGKE